MAIGGVVINFMAKTRDAVRDVDRFTRSLDKADRELDQVDTSLETTERGFDELARETATTATRMKQDMKGMSGAVREGAADIDVETSKLSTDMGEAGRESGSELISNIAEGIGSGQANLNDVLQGTLGGITNMAASMAGPIGLVAGAAAAGVGLLFAKVTQENEKAAEKLQNTLDALQGIVDLSSKEAEVAIFNQWIEDAKKVEGKIQDVTDVLAIAGVSAEEWQGALAGSPDDLEVVRQKLLDQADAIYKAKENTGDLTTEQSKYLEKLPMVSGELGDQNTASWKAKETQSAINDLTDGAITKTGRWEEEMGGVNSEAENVEDTIGRIPDKKKIAISYTQTNNPWGAAPGTPGRSAPQVAGYSAPVTINYYTSRGPNPYSDGRTLKRLLEGEDLEQGRPRGAPLRVAW